MAEHPESFVTSSRRGKILLAADILALASTYLFVGLFAAYYLLLGMAWVVCWNWVVGFVVPPPEAKEAPDAR